MEFSIILAADNNLGIGKNGSVPWKSSFDMKLFREITNGQFQNLYNWEHRVANILPEGKQNAMIMGRKTADSFVRPLPNRVNIVVTTKDSYRDGFEIASSLNSALIALSKRNDINRVFLIGGADLAEEGIQNNWCRTIFMTRILGSYNCDVRLSPKFMSVLKKFNVINHIINVPDGDLADTICEHGINNVGERAYLDLGNKILKHGDYRQNRNAKTYSLFGEKLEFDILENEDGTFQIPILTTKQIFTRGVNEELLFFMLGKTDTLELERNGIFIWNGNTKKEFLEANNLNNLKPGEMGPMYGFLWRYFGAVYKGSNHDYTGEGIDQLKNCILKIVEDPNSRRNLMTTYNPTQAEDGVLYPCHGIVTQFYVEGDNRISLQTYQRSADYFLGLPFNIMSYSVLLCLIVKLVNGELEKRGELKRYSTGRMITVLGDVHIYSDLDENGNGIDHVQAVNTELERIDKAYRFPSIRIDKDIRDLNDLLDMKASDIKILNYARHPTIKAEMVA